MSDRPARAGWRRIAERSALALGLARLGRAARRGRALVLAYHNVVPDSAARTGDGSLHLALSDFNRQLDHLGRCFDVIGLDALAAAAPSAGRPRVALTFDDAYAGAVKLGLPELARRGWPATVFVAPGILGVESLWWDRCAGLEDWARGLRDRCLGELAGRESAVAAWERGRGHRPAPLSPWHRIATEADLQAAGAAPGLTFGAHGWSHVNLTAVSPDELAAETARPLEWLRARLPRARPWLAYPYGLFSDPVIEAARSAGYEAAFAVSGGWLPPSGRDPLRLPRWNVPAGVSPAGFELRAAGRLAR